MKKLLVIVAHPDIQHSTIHKQWIKMLKNYQEIITVYELYQHLSFKDIKVHEQQTLLENHESVIFQFPVHWFSSPALLKQWFDQVLTYGWAFGKGGDKLRHKKIGLAVSAGIQQKDYSPEGRYRYSLQRVFTPFELTIDYVQADYRSFFAVYGATNEPEAGYGITHAEIQASTVDYLEWINTEFGLTLSYS